MNANVREFGWIWMGESGNESGTERRDADDLPEFAAAGISGFRICVDSRAFVVEISQVPGVLDSVGDPAHGWARRKR